MMCRILSLCAYSSALSNLGWWWYQLLNHFNTEQWNAIGVIGGLLFTFLTWLTNLLFKIYEVR